MQRGYLQDNAQPVQWIPEGGKPPFWKWQVAKNAVRLDGGSGWSGYTAAAHYCAACGMVIVPVRATPD